MRISIVPTEEYRPARSARAELNARPNRLPPEIKVFQAAIAGTRTSLDTLFEQISIKLDEGTRARVENVLYELDLGMAQPLSQPSDHDAAGYPDAGASHPDGRPRQLAADHLYVLQAAAVPSGSASISCVSASARSPHSSSSSLPGGDPVIADASRLGGDAPINPYFVSFLAIISGLMSDRAIISVQAQAGRFFGPEGGARAPRWARHDLTDKFAQANRKPAEVKKLLNADDAEFGEWIGRNKIDTRRRAEDDCRRAGQACPRAVHRYSAGRIAKTPHRRNAHVDTLAGLVRRQPKPQRHGAGQRDDGAALVPVRHLRQRRDQVLVGLRALRRTRLGIHRADRDRDGIAGDRRPVPARACTTGRSARGRLARSPEPARACRRASGASRAPCRGRTGEGGLRQTGPQSQY